MKLYIVRHGATELNGTDVFRGRRDVPLSDPGRRQSEQTADYFRDKSIKRIITSPLVRAQDTALAISQVTGDLNRVTQVIGISVTTMGAP